MSSRNIDRRYRNTQLLFANDHGSVESDRRGDSRRRSKRLRVHLWMEVNNGQETRILFAPELSENGTFLVLDRPLNLGENLTLRFSLPRDPLDIVVHGRVASIRVTGSEPSLHTGNGIAFDSISDDAVAQIKRYFEWINRTQKKGTVKLPGLL